MLLPDLLPIQPFTRPARGEITLPGSKSLTNRALMLAALCDTPVRLTGALFSEDTHLMSAALRKIGFIVVANEAEKTLDVLDQPNAFTSEAPLDLFVGLAGTAARFLTAMCAAAPRGIFRLDGVPQMRKRPMRGLIDALRSLGAEIRCLDVEGFLPLEIYARGLVGGAVCVDASESSQFLSALLMAAPLARGEIEVALAAGVRRTFVEMTFRLMLEFSVRIRTSEDKMHFVVRGPTHYMSPGRYEIEPDATAASYFHGLAFVTRGQLAMPGLRAPGAGLQGDSVFPEVLDRASRRSAGTLFTEDFREISDTFLTLAAIAPLFDGPTRITGIAHTRKQETDRVAGMARELKKLGQEVEETEDTLTITPQPLRSDVEIETYGDHRFAMSFAILGCHNFRGNGTPWLAIRNPACCAKTFPHFFELLETVRQKSLAA